MSIDIKVATSLLGYAIKNAEVAYARGKELEGDKNYPGMSGALECGIEFAILDMKQILTQLKGD